jgi:hypothetical protein
LHARALLARVEADPERMVVEVVDGRPPDVPRFDADYPRDREGVLGRCPHGVDLDRDFCPHGCRV